jgi:serine/threonine-protein kinase HipA
MKMQTMLPEKIRALGVSIGDAPQAGQLLKTSVYEFRYLSPEPQQPAVALLMPPSERLTWQEATCLRPWTRTCQRATCS